MARLEDLTRGESVKGISSDGPVVIVDVVWHPSSAVEVMFSR